MSRKVSTSELVHGAKSLIGTSEGKKNAQNLNRSSKLTELILRRKSEAKALEIFCVEKRNSKNRMKLIDSIWRYENSEAKLK